MPLRQRIYEPVQRGHRWRARPQHAKCAVTFLASEDLFGALFGVALKPHAVRQLGMV